MRYPALFASVFASWIDFPGARGRQHMSARFGSKRLVADMAAPDNELMRERSDGAVRAAQA